MGRGVKSRSAAAHGLRRMAVIMLKGGVAAGLCAWLLTCVPWADTQRTAADGTVITEAGLLRTLRTARVAPLLAACGCALGSTLTAAWRWRAVAALFGVRVGAWQTVRVALISECGNLLLPGAIAGDAVKVYLVRGPQCRATTGVMTVLVDRASGVVGLVLVAGVTGALAGACGVVRGAALRAPLVAGTMVAVALAGLLLAAGSPMLRRVLHLEALLARVTGGQGLADLRRMRAALYHAPWIVLHLVALTLGAQALAICAALLVGRSAGLPVAWYWYPLCVPLVTLLSAVPITPGGMGVAENLYAWFLTPVAAPARSVAFALLVRGTLLAAALPGVAMLLAGPRRAAAATATRPAGACAPVPL